MNSQFIRRLLAVRRSRGFQAPVDTPVAPSTPRHTTARQARGTTSKRYIKDGELREEQLKAAQAQQAYYAMKKRWFPWQAGIATIGSTTSAASILLFLHKLLNPEFISDKAAQTVVKTVDKSRDQLADRVSEAKDKGQDYLYNKLPQELAKIQQHARQEALARLQRVPNTLPSMLQSIPEQHPIRQYTGFNSPASAQPSDNAPQRPAYNPGDYLQYAVPQGYKNIYQQVGRGNYYPLIPIGYSVVPKVLKQLSEVHK